MPELLEVLRFQKEELATTPPVRVRAPLVRRLPVPDRRAAEDPAPRSTGSRASSTCRRRRSTSCASTAAGSDPRLRATSPASARPSRAAQKVERRRAAGRPAAARAAATSRRCGCATDARAPARRDRARSGQALTRPVVVGLRGDARPARARRQGRRRGRRWELYVTVRAGGIRRRRVALRARPGDPRRASCPAGDGRARAAPCRRRPTASTWSCAAPGPRCDGVRQPGDGAAALAGTIRPDAPQKAKLEAERRADAVARRVPLDRRGPGGSRAQVSLDELAQGRADARRRDPARPRRGRACGSSPRRSAAAAGCPSLVPDRLAGAVARRDGDRSSRSTRTRQGDAALVERTPRAVVETAAGTRRRARSSCAGTLPLDGDAALVLRLRDGVEEHAVPVRGEAGRFSAHAHAGGDPLVAGHAAAARGHVASCPARRRPAETPVMVVARARRPAARSSNGRAQGLQRSRRRARTARRSLVERDLDDDERGPFHQRRLRATVDAPPAAPAAARRGRLRSASAAASTPTARARSTRSSCAAARRSSTCGWCATARCAVPGRRRRAARGQPRVPRGARHARATSSPTTSCPGWFRRAGRPGVSCRRCTARRSAARASTSPRSAARRGGC